MISEIKYYKQGKDSMLIFLSEKITLDNNGNRIYNIDKWLDKKIDFSRFDISQQKKY